MPMRKGGGRARSSVEHLIFEASDLVSDRAIPTYDKRMGSQTKTIRYSVARGLKGSFDASDVIRAQG